MFTLCSFYTYSTGSSEGGGCPDPFMAQTYRLPPACGSRCCRPSHEGKFQSIDDAVEEKETFPSAMLVQPLPTRLEFQPSDSTCRYKMISRGQFMQYMAQNNASLLIMGDSTQRQLFLKFIGMLRGQPRAVDFHVHTHANYQLCREVCL